MTTGKIWHRPLADMLTDVFDAVLVARHDTPMIYARRVDLTLPLEVRFQQGPDGPEFIGDLPAWRWRTDFDRQPSRLSIAWEEVEL